MGNSESVEDRAREFWFEHCGDFTQDAWEKMASFTQLETASLRAENDQLKIALADAIRRPMGVVPDSAQGLVTQDEVQAAEERRLGIIEEDDT